MSNLGNITYRLQNSIRYRILILVALSMLIPIILFVSYMYYYTYKYIYTQEISRNLDMSLGLIDDSIVSNFRITENTFNVFLANQEIRDNLNILKHNDTTYYTEAKSRLNIETQMKYSLSHDYGWSRGLLKSAFIFADKEKIYYLLDTYLPNDDIVKEYKKFYTDLTDKDIDYSYRYNSIEIKKVVENQITKENMGTIILGIDDIKIQDALSNVVPYKDALTIIYDDKGKIYYHNRKYMIGEYIDRDLLNLAKMKNGSKILYDNKEYFIGIKSINDINLHTMLLIPRKYFSANLSSMIPEYLYLILFTGILSIIISIFVIANITMPIKDLKNNINEIRVGNFTSKMPRYRYNELNEVSEAFNDMIDQIQHLFNEVYEKQILVSQAELKALQAQINPHFLFNVLETISWEARMSDNDTIYKMVNSLGELLRASLTFNTGEQIKLRDELKYIEFYIYLQKTRFGDRLDINLNIDDESLLAIDLPKLCIQPIVENAIIHGLETKIGHGQLDVNIYKEDMLIKIDVIDDGVGFNVEDFDKDSDISTDAHIGIYNVHKRIKLLFGEEYGLCIDSKLNQGTKVSIIIPYNGGKSYEHSNDC